MFILSKLVGFLLNPLIWIGLCLLFSWFFKSTRAFLIRLCVLLFIVFTNPLLSNWVLSQLEQPSVKLSEEDHFEAGILLTGMTSALIEKPGVHFESGADRFTAAVALYHDQVIDKIVITGGSGLIDDEQYTESPLLAQLALRLQVPDSVLILEENSRNTYENAQFTQPILDSLGIKSSLLITSAFHMYRSERCFKGLEIPVTTYPTDFRAGKIDLSIYNLIPSNSALSNWETILHEWFGIIYYQLRGYI